MMSDEKAHKRNHPHMHSRTHIHEAATKINEIAVHNVELNIAFVPRRGYIGNMDELEGT